MPIHEVNTDTNEEYGWLYASAGHGDERDIVKDIENCRNKQLPLTVYRYENWRATTPLLRAIIYNNEPTTRILCHEIKKDRKKLGELLTYISQGDFPLTSAIKTGHADIVEHLIDASADIHIKSKDSTTLSAALTAIPVYALIKYGHWNNVEQTSSEFQQQLDKFHRWRSSTKKERQHPFPSAATSVGHTVYWDGNLKIIKSLLNRNANPNDVPPGGDSVNELLQNIVNYAKNPSKPLFKADHPDCNLRFIKDGSDENTLVFSMSMVSSNGACVSDPIKVILDLRKIRLAIDEANKKLVEKEVKEAKEKRELDETQLKLLQAKLASLEFNIKERDSEAFDFLSALEKDELMRKHESQRAHEEAQLKVFALQRTVDENTREVDALSSTAGDLKTKLEITQSALAHQIDLGTRENNLKAQNFGTLVMDFGVHFTNHFRTNLYTGVVLSGNDVTRQKNKFLDNVGGALQTVAGLIHFPILSSLVSGIGSGVQAYSDHREQSKNKKLNTSLADLSIEDFIKAVRIELLETFQNSLHPFKETKHIQELAELASQEMTAALKGGKIKPAVNYKEVCQQLAAVIQCSKKYNDKYQLLLSKQPKSASIQPAAYAMHRAAGSPPPLPPKPAKAQGLPTSMFKTAAAH